MDFEWLLLAFLPALGHVLYGLPPDPKDAPNSRITLHNGDGFSERDTAPSPDRVLAVRAVSAAGIFPLSAEGGREGGVTVDVSAVVDRPCWVVVETPPTFIDLAAEKFHGYLEHEGLDAVIRQRESAGQESEPGREIYSKYVKIALNADDGSVRLPTEPVGLAVEVVPLLDAALGVGATLPVRVLVGGRPAADLQVRVSHRESEQAAPSADTLWRTDAAGCAAIPIDRRGLWRLHTIAMSPVDGAEADWESLWACLTFRL